MMNIRGMRSYAKNLAGAYRAQIEKAQSNKRETFSSGFDVGYALGRAHAYENIADKLQYEPKGESNVQSNG